MSLAEPNKEVNESSKILYWRDQRDEEMHRRNRETQNEVKR